MSKLYIPIFTLIGILSFPLSTYADNSETTTIKNIPAETQSTTITKTQEDPMLIQDSAGNSTFIQPSGTSTTIDTTTNGNSTKEKTIVKKKNTPHHLINLFGLIKIL